MGSMHGISRSSWGFLPASIIRLASPLLAEQPEEWAIARCYMSLRSRTGYPRIC